MVNTVVIQGYVSKVNTFIFGKDRTGIHFDLEHQVFHQKNKKEAAHYAYEIFHCVALGDTVKRLLAECEDGNPLIEEGIIMTVRGKLTVRKNKNKKGEVTSENVSIVLSDFKVNSKRKPKAEEAAAPAPSEAASSDIKFELPIF